MQLGILFLVSEITKHIAAILGMGAFLFPDAAPLSLALCLLMMVCIGVNFRNIIGGFTLITLLIVTVISVGGGIFSPLIVTAAFSALVLATSKPALALIIIALQASYTTSLQALLANYLHQWNLEMASPSLLACAVILVTCSGLKWKSLLLPFLCIGVAVVGLEVLPTLQSVFLLTSVPAIFLALVTVRQPPIIQARPFARWLCFAFVTGGLLGWVYSPPRLAADRYVLVSEARTDTVAGYEALDR